jgi:hypothetical protein
VGRFRSVYTTLVDERKESRPLRDLEVDGSIIIIIIIIIN